MEESKTPQWLIDAQNKSWEPEILISGITLTFLFLMSSYFYNFFAMLIQDHAVFARLAHVSYTVSIVLLNGLTIILIIHLVLRGVWTGFVGLSYVFPEGVNRKRLSKSNINTKFRKPKNFVIATEKICSLLFSFIFSVITYVLAATSIYIPLILLFFLDLDLIIIRQIIIYGVFTIVAILVLITVLLETKWKDSRFQQMLNSSFVSTILAIYFTNVGKIKSMAVFLLYFTLITLYSLPEISNFEFKNYESSEIKYEEGIVTLIDDYYKDLRDNEFRIPKAVLNEFHVTGRRIELFISFYKEDLFTLKQINKNPSLIEKYFDFSGTEIKSLQDLYRITLDGKMVPELRWYSKKLNETGQRGYISAIPVDNLETGYHELKIDKILWVVKGDSLLLVKDWIAIPFEKADK